MLAALGTLPFLVTIWLVVVVGASVLEESGGKIAAALKGEPALRPSAKIVEIRERRRAAPIQPMSAGQRWRAAA
jgi:hypothetical protein